MFSRRKNSKKPKMIFGILVFGGIVEKNGVFPGTFNLPRPGGSMFSGVKKEKPKKNFYNWVLGALMGKNP